MLLDLTNVKNIGIKEIFKGNLVLPIRDGQHYKDVDVIEEACDPDFVWKVKYRAKRLLRKQGLRTGRNVWLRPIGFDLKELPKGAVIINEH